METLHLLDNSGVEQLLRCLETNMEDYILYTSASRALLAASEHETQTETQSKKRKLEIQTAELSYDLNIQDMNSSPRDDPDSGSLEEVRRPVTRRAAAAARLPLEFDSDSDDYAPSAKRPKKSEAPEAGEAASTEFPSSRYLTIDGKIYPNYLPPSKNPCLDALGYCVKLRLGAEQSAEDLVEGRVSIFDCEQLLQYIKHFCPKASQTSNDEYRVKALKRWFTGIPTKKARLSGNSFEIQMKPERRGAIQKAFQRIDAWSSGGNEDEMDAPEEGQYDS